MFSDTALGSGNHRQSEDHKLKFVRAALPYHINVSYLFTVLFFVALLLVCLACSLLRLGWYNHLVGNVLSSLSFCLVLVF